MAAETALGPEPSRTLSVDLISVVQQTGCDPLTVPFNPALDERCVQYMTNSANWESLAVLAPAYDERTVKFKLKFKHHPLQGIMKLPQQYGTLPQEQLNFMVRCAFKADVATFSSSPKSFKHFRELYSSIQHLG